MNAIQELRVLGGGTVDDNRFIRRCVPGQGFGPTFRLPCPDDCGSQLGFDETTNYWLTRVDPRPVTPCFEDLARIPFAARALAFDGAQFWTNHREQHPIVSFARPD